MGGARWVPAAPLGTRRPSPRAPQAAPRRAGRGRRGGLARRRREPGCVRESGRLRRAPSPRPRAPRQPAPWGSLGAPPALSSGAAERAPSRPPSPRRPPPLAARPPRPALHAPAGPLLLPTCPRRLRGRGETLLRLGAHTHPATPAPSPPPPGSPTPRLPPPPTPVLPPRRRAPPSERTAPTTAAAPGRSPPARATSRGRRRATFPNSAAAARLPRSPPPTANPRNKPSTKKCLPSLLPPTPPTPLRSPSHTRD